MPASVDKYFSHAPQWPEEMKALREILLGCGLAEDLKWGKPCYSFHDKNIAIIQPFKAYCALLFFKGVLLRDEKGLLEKTGENTRVGRQMRFTSTRDIAKLRADLKAYLHEAVELEKAGVKVAAVQQEPLVVVEELSAALKKDPALNKAFNALTPGRQRAYNLHFSGAKQASTRIARIAKSVPNILKGKGFNER